MLDRFPFYIHTHISFGTLQEMHNEQNESVRFYNYITVVKKTTAEQTLIVCLILDMNNNALCH